jgi:hypothetical protein
MHPIALQASPRPQIDAPSRGAWRSDRFVRTVQTSSTHALLHVRFQMAGDASFGAGRIRMKEIDVRRPCVALAVAPSADCSGASESVNCSPVTMDDVLATVAELGPASVELVAWEFCVSVDEILGPWRQAIESGAIRPIGICPVMGELLFAPAAAPWHAGLTAGLRARPAAVA